MRATLYLTVLAALSSYSLAVEEPTFYGRQLRPLDLPVDQETVRYLLPKLAAKYRPNSEWADVVDPRFYLLTEMESDDLKDQAGTDKNIRNKRYNYERRSRPRTERYAGGETVLSINAPIKTLQKLYYQERIRQRLAKNERFLENLVDSQ